jgi:signal peptidase I
MEGASERVFRITGWIYDFTKVVTVLLLVFLLTNYFLVSILIVSGSSMTPNYPNGHVYAINKIAYHSSTPKRGDVVAIVLNQNQQERLVKRIIGLPGETVQINNGQVYINGQLLAEKYLPSGTTTAPNSITTLGKEQYFVMGDNRTVSADSRDWGSVTSSEIVGKVVL